MLSISKITTLIINQFGERVINLFASGNSDVACSLSLCQDPECEVVNDILQSWEMYLLYY